LVQAKGRGWTLRRRVPDDIRQIIGKREVWRSLKAKSHAEARRLLPLENAKVEALFAEARRRLTETALSPATPAQALPEPNLPEPTEAVVRDAVRHWFHQLERKAEAEDKAILGQQDAETVIDNLRVDQAQLDGPQGDALVAGLVRDVLRTHGFAQPTGDGLVLATGLVQAALIEGVRRSLARLGDQDGLGEPDRLLKDIAGLGEAPPPPAAQPISEAKAPLLAEGLLIAWAAETNPSAATMKAYTATFRQIARILGFDDVRRITPDDVVKFKTARLAEGRDAGTVADNVLAAGAVCNWAVKNRMLASNPFAGLAPKVTRRGPAPRAPYDDAEAAHILAAARSEAGWLRWAPWLLCFTGARIGELAELRRRDVRREGEVWFLDIVPTEVRAGKNATMQRMIPLHPAVLAEGFLAYVAALPPDPLGPLFPSIKPDPRGGRITPATTTMGRWMHGKVEITAKGKAPSHSWRHRMQDELRKVRAQPEVVDAITGRYNPRNAGEGYGRGFRGMPEELLLDLAKVPNPLKR
jgi:integrase